MSTPTPQNTDLGTQSDLFAQTWKYRIKRWRRALRARLSLWAARRYGTPLPKPGQLTAAPQRILVCRLNKRLGNVLFLTPLLTSLAATFPKTRIDVLLRDPQHVDLLQGLPGIGRVWVPPAKPITHVWALLAFIRALRKHRFDLVIDPNDLSVSNRLGVLLCGAKRRLGFAGKDQWLRLDYAAPHPRDEPHQALAALHLLSDGLTRLTPTLLRNYRVAPGADALIKAEQYWRDAFDGVPPHTPVVGFFIQATDAKQLPPSWWRAWLAAMQSAPEAPRLLQLLPPGDTPALSPGVACLRIAPLGELAATLAHLQMFVAADSGPMHLAAAAGVPTLGLFCATDPAHYRPLGPGCTTLQGKALDPVAVAARTLVQLRQEH